MPAHAEGGKAASAAVASAYNQRLRALLRFRRGFATLVPGFRNLTTSAALQQLDPIIHEFRIQPPGGDALRHALEQAVEVIATD
jgi:hypothetical protein